MGFVLQWLSFVKSAALPELPVFNGKVHRKMAATTVLPTLGKTWLSFFSFVDNKVLGLVYTCDFLQVFVFFRSCCDKFLKFPTGFNTHFIAEQSQNAKKNRNEKWGLMFIWVALSIIHAMSPAQLLWSPFHRCRLFMRWVCVVFVRPWRRSFPDRGRSRRGFTAETTQERTATVTTDQRAATQQPVYREIKKAARIPTDIPLSCSCNVWLHLLSLGFIKMW